MADDLLGALKRSINQAKLDAIARRLSPTGRRYLTACATWNPNGNYAAPQTTASCRRALASRGLIDLDQPFDADGVISYRDMPTPLGLALLAHLGDLDG